MWLSRMRWMAIVAQIFSLWLGLRLEMIDPREAPLFGGIIATIACFNRWVTRASPQGRHVLLAHLLLDLGCLIALLSLAGGCANPMVALIFLHAGLGPMLLVGGDSLLYLLAICMSLGTVCYMTPPHGATHVVTGFDRILRLGSEIFVVCAIWGMTSWLSSTMAKLRTVLAGAQRKQQRSEHLRALGAMASGFSHEFATPLNTAKMRLERALRVVPRVDGPPPDPHAELTAALAAVEQCEGVLRGLFGTQLDAGSVRFSEFDLGAFVERICARWKGEKGDMVVRIVPPAHEMNVRCIAPQIALSKTLLDLLDNAAEATKNGGGHVRQPIDVQLDTSQGQARIAISDRGCGFPENLKDRVGEPFATSRSGGTGLGLYAAHGLMDALGGLLEIIPRDGGGTTVMLTFPLIGSQ